MRYRILIVAALMVAASGRADGQTEQTPAASPKETPARQKPRPVDPLKALEDRAASGTAEDKFNVAESYRTGAHGRIDTGTALMWYVRAASQGHELAAARIEELSRPFVKVEAAPKAAVTLPDPAPPPVLREVESRDGLALPIASVALLLSLAAVVFSWTRTRRALKDAGLL